MYKDRLFMRSNSAYMVVLFIVISIVILLMTKPAENALVLALSVAFLIIYLYTYNKIVVLSDEIKDMENELDIYKDLLQDKHYCLQLSDDMRILSANKRLCNLLNLPKKQIQGKVFFDLFSFKDSQKAQILLNDNLYYQEKIYFDQNDQSVELHIHLYKKILKHRVFHYVVLKNPKEKVKITSKIKEEVLRDDITGLPTRLKLFDDIKNLNQKSIFARSTMMYLNVDSFDVLNEFFGIDAGNIILKRVAEWLEANLPDPNAALYKVDFNHFAIFTPAYMRTETLEKYLRDIFINLSKEEFMFEGSSFNIEITAGAARGREDLVKNAYLALKEAEKLKKSYKIFDKKEKHHERFLHNIKINKMVKKAISDRRIEPFFQPIFNIHTNKIEKYESLMRIRCEDNSYATPSEFMDIAKKSKIYTELSRAMIKKCFEQLLNVRYPITINISTEDMLEPRVAQFILRSLKKHDFGRYITFEIIESESINAEVKVKNFIKKVKSYGCQIAIDDFGSGFSNFEQLLALEVDYIKIDGSLIKNITKDKNSEIMTRTIISMAKELNVKTVAEFVSSQAIFDKVKSLGIDYAQGYFIDRADPVLLKNT